MSLPLGAPAIYDWLMAGAQPRGAEDFDLHVLASIFAIGLQEAQDSAAPLGPCTGLQPEAAQALACRYFPGRAAPLAALAGAREHGLDVEEQSVRDLLWMYASDGSDVQRWLAAMIARRCLRPNHLWQDLNLRNRRELSALMQRHFAGLAARNTHDMKWKKFLYRTICGSEGFRICASPVCSECDDYDACFGPEEDFNETAPNRLAPSHRTEARI